MQEKSKKVETVAQRVDSAVFGGVLAMIVIGPWFRGLFFPLEQMVALFIILVLFVARCWTKFSRNDHSFLRVPLDWAVLGLFLAYIISTLVAVDMRAAIQADIKYLLLFIAYWLVRESARDERRRTMVLGAVALTGLWVAILGVGAAAGTFDYNGAFTAPRIYSVFQYPNTLAAYLTAAFFCALALWSRAAGTREDIRRAWPIFLWALAAYAGLFVFIFTYSRGALLVFPAVAAAFMVLQGKGYRVNSALILLVQILSVGLAGRYFPAAVAAENGAGAWGAFLLGMPLALVGSLAVVLFNRVPGRQRVMAIGTAAGLGTVLMGFLLVYLRLPAQVSARIGTISLGDFDAWSRIQWAKDAFKIVKDHPLIGGGGGAWDALYHQYQDYVYFSTEIHNHFLQVWVETGTLGFLAFLAILALTARTGWQTWHRVSPSERIPLAGAGAGILALVLHSSIDFNLSLAAVSIALWTLMGVVGAANLELAGEPDVSPGGREYQLIPRLGVYALSGLAMAGVLPLMSGFGYGMQAARAFNSDRLEDARSLYEKAASRDPFQASYRIDLGQVYQALAVNEADPVRQAELLDRARAAVEKGIRLAPTDPRFLTVGGIVLLRSGYWNEGLAAIEQAKVSEPQSLVGYENYARALINVAWEKIRAGEREGADELVGRVLALQEEIAGVSSRAPDRESVRVIPAGSPVLYLRWGQARAMRGELAEAEGLLVAGLNNPDPLQRADALLWLGAVREAMGRLDEAVTAFNEAEDITPGRSGEPDRIRGFIGSIDPRS